MNENEESLSADSSPAGIPVVQDSKVRDYYSLEVAIDNLAGQLLTLRVEVMHLAPECYEEVEDLFLEAAELVVAAKVPLMADLAHHVHELTRGGQGDGSHSVPPVSGEPDAGAG